MAGKYETRAERRRQLQANKKKKRNIKKGKGSVLKTIILSLFTIGIVALLAGIGTFAYYASSAPKLDEAVLVDPISSELYDMNGDLIMTLGIENRDYIEYDKIPKLVEDAVLATEDVRFYKHHGIDFIRFGGAIIANITRGFGSEGASTLSQQVVKNSFLEPEKTIKRKVQEAWLAAQLERKYTKQEIFEMYVNKVLMSGSVYGLETAAKHFYGKGLKDVNLPEAALLAGMPQSPNRYNPFKHPEKAEKRRNIVLDLMYKHGKITKEEMEKAKSTSVTESLLPEEEREGPAYKYDSFVDRVIEEVNEVGDYNIFTDGLKIYTTLDPEAQEYTEKMLNSDEIIAFPDEKFQAGIALLDTASGEIRALGGGRNQEVQRGFNFATDLERQLGSTIKPILDYGPAIEYLKWSTYQQIVDEPYSYSDGTKVNNVDNNHLGQMTIREALYRSRNIPALKALQEVGLDKAKQFAANLGFHFKNIYESSSLGGGEGGSPLQLAGAYATFGNNGIYNEPHAVKKIVLRDGETEVKLKPESELAMKDYTAYMITDMLKDVLSKGTGQNANIPGLPLAGKTGTTNYTAEEKQKYNIPVGGVPDVWFAGYTTKYTAAVWTGYGKKENYIQDNDRRKAQLIFKQLMAHVSEGVDTPDFKMPKSVVKAPVESGTNPPKKPSPQTPKDQIVYELFVKGTEPTDVSKQFDKLAAPTGLKASYDESSGEIKLSWKHKDSDGIQFEVSASTNDGAKQTLTTTGDKSYTFSQAKQGNKYVFQVVAVKDNRKSDPVTATVNLRTEEDVEEDSDENEEEETSDDNDDDHDQEDQSDEENGNNKDDEKNDNNNGNDKDKGNRSDNGKDDDNNEKDKDKGKSDNNNGNDKDKGNDDNNNGKDNDKGKGDDNNGKDRDEGKDSGGNDDGGPPKDAEDDS